MRNFQQALEALEDYIDKMQDSRNKSICITCIENAIMAYLSELNDYSDIREVIPQELEGFDLVQYILSPDCRIVIGLQREYITDQLITIYLRIR